MADIASAFDSEAFMADLMMSGGLLQEDGTAETAIIISLFSDRRAEPDDELPVGHDDRRGWWGDAMPLANADAAEGDRIGSRLWLLKREKQTQETLNRARGYIEEALAWTIADGVFASLDVTVSWVADGVLAFVVVGQFPAGGEYRRQFITKLLGG